MAGDDNETKGSGDDTSSLPRTPVQPARALARIREAAEADRKRKGGRFLALVPVTIGVLVLLLVMPRATPPGDIPVPNIDTRVLREVTRSDDLRAAAAESTRLPAGVVEVGTALRALSGAEARGADELARIDARRRLDTALRDLGGREEATADLISLRALQTRRFLDALSAWEGTGERSEDFEDLAASFVVRADAAGWITNGRHLVLDEAERRVMFKTFWNLLAGADARPALALTTDEERALYAFYIKHPHPPESSRLALETDRRLATSPEACARVNRESARQSALWLADKLKRLGEIDPTYPMAYGVGVAYYRAGRSELASEAFAAFIKAHPDGAYALRARNHLKALLSPSDQR